MITTLTHRPLTLALASATVIAFALASAPFTSRGPVTSTQALATMVAALAVGMIVAAVNYGLFVVAPMVLGGLVALEVAPRLGVSVSPPLGSGRWIAASALAVTLAAVGVVVARPAPTAPILGADGRALQGSVAQLTTATIGRKPQAITIRERSTRGTGKSDDARFDRIDAFVRDEMRAARIPGIAIAIVEGGETVHATAYGHDGRGNAVTPDTPFWIGSNTKSMTALAVMQLVEDGLVELDAPVQRYLPEFRVADAVASSRITVRHLLHQTSGLARIDGLRAVAQTTDESLADVVAGMRDLELNRPVGESFEYANLNSVVLGLLVERVVGQRWQTYVQSRIFDPLGMTRTFTSPELAGRQGVTATHRSAFGFPIRTEGRPIEGLASSGYVYSTAHDMARYLAAYVNGGAAGDRRVLSDAGVAAMLTLATNERTFPLQSHVFTAGYGAGWFVGRFGVADDARWHQGSLPHFTAWTVLLPDTDQAVVVLMNAGNQFEIAGANGAWSRIPQGIVNLMRGADPPTGMSAARFFGVFDTLVALAVAGQAWALVRVARRWRGRPTSTLRRTAPLAWELIAAPLVLIAYPAVTGGLGWKTAFEFLPDLSLTVLVIAGLAVLTGLIRVVRLARSRSRSLVPVARTAAALPAAGP